jgi:hypothetical protein
MGRVYKKKIDCHEDGWGRGLTKNDSKKNQQKNKKEQKAPAAWGLLCCSGAGWEECCGW